MAHQITAAFTGMGQALETRGSRPHLPVRLAHVLLVTAAVVLGAATLLLLTCLGVMHAIPHGLAPPG